MTTSTSAPARVALTGVTGHLGGAVARELAADGAALRLLARRPEAVEPLPGAVTMPIAYADTPRTRQSLSGAEVLLMISAHESPARVAEHRALVDAAAAAGVEHVVYTSFRGASAGAAFTRRDVAAVAAQVLRRPARWAGRTLDLTGPQDLSMEQIATTVGRRLGRRIPYIDQSVEEAYESRRAWPAQQWEYDAWVSTYTAIRDGHQAGVSADVSEVLGREPESLQDYLDRTLDD